MHIVDHLVDASAEEMTKNGFLADLMRDYAVNLMKILREKYPIEWKEDWQNEAYLGITCGLVFREEEAFKHIENAYKHVEDPPQSLILAYISAGNGSDQFLSKKRLAELSLMAIEKGLTYEAALRMAALAYEEKNFFLQEYWTNQAAEAEKKEWHTPFIIPNVLKNEYKNEK